MIVSPSTHKPLYLLHLLHTLKLDSALCFTKSVEAATRLAKLVEFFEEAYASVVEAGEEKQEERKKVVVKAYSSELPAGERTRLLQQFKKGEVQMYVRPLDSSLTPGSAELTLVPLRRHAGSSARILSRAVSTCPPSRMSSRTTSPPTRASMCIAWDVRRVLEGRERDGVW